MHISVELYLMMIDIVEISWIFIEISIILSVYLIVLKLTLESSEHFQD